MVHINRGKSGKQHIRETATLERRSKVSKLALQGMGQIAIAKKLGVAQGTIAKDYAALKVQAAEESKINAPKLREQHRARLEHYLSFVDKRLDEIANTGSFAGIEKPLETAARYLDQLAKLDGLYQSIPNQDAPINVTYNGRQITIDARQVNVTPTEVRQSPYKSKGTRKHYVPALEDDSDEDEDESNPMLSLP